MPATGSGSEDNGSNLFGVAALGAAAALFAAKKLRDEQPVEAEDEV